MPGPVPVPVLVPPVVLDLPEQRAQPSPPRVEVNDYPGEGHSLAGAEANAHAVQSAVAFLREHLTK